MGSFTSKNGMFRAFGLRGSKRYERNKKIRQRKFDPLDGKQMSEIESDLGSSEPEQKKRRRSRRFAKVADSLLGGSESKRLGG